MQKDESVYMVIAISFIILIALTVVVVSNDFIFLGTFVFLGWIAWLLFWGINIGIDIGRKVKQDEQRPLIQDPTEVERDILRRIKNKAVEYKPLYYALPFDNGRTSLKDDMKTIGGLNWDGNYHFCKFVPRKDYVSPETLEWERNAYFSNSFNEICERHFKNLLANGLERVKQDIIATSDYYLTDLCVSIKPKYIALKLEEAEIRYRIEKQRADDREEAKTQKEFERALKKAEKDEQKAREKLEEERKALTLVESEKERAKLEARIAKLEEAMVQAQETQKRALSMAQQTRSGYVYVISNKGSFGEGVFKIGMTRRLDPMERVIELGDASVPFPFDVHTFIFSDDAPGLEAKLHQRFTDQRVNMLNNRKEFFRVSLDEIKKALEEFGVDTVWADDDIPGKSPSVHDPAN